MRVKVKICGITSVDDARMVVEAGADAVGLVFAESPRQVNLETASGIVKALPPFVEPVGVFVNEPSDRIVTECRRARISTVQLCGAESADDVALLQRDGLKVIKAIHIAPDGTLGKNVPPLLSGEGWGEGNEALGADAVLLDTRIPGLDGGTGVTFDVSPAKHLRFDVPVILAGGLIPENVAERVREIRPYAVDVSSGIESSPGKKDRGLVWRFIEASQAL